MPGYPRQPRRIIAGLIRIEPNAYGWLSGERFGKLYVAIAQLRANGSLKGGREWGVYKSMSL